MGFETILPMVTSVISGLAKGGSGGGAGGGGGQQPAPAAQVPMNPQSGVQNPAIMQAAQQSSPSMLQQPQQMLPLTPNDPSMLTGGIDNPDYWTKLLGGMNGR